MDAVGGKGVEGIEGSGGAGGCEGGFWERGAKRAHRRGLGLMWLAMTCDRRNR